MPEGFDAAEMILRFRERAAAVRRRGLPPVEGAERQLILRQMQLDFQDFAMLGDATASLEDGILTLRIDLRPAEPPPDSRPEPPPDSRPEPPPDSRPESRNGSTSEQD